jgi:hypothetical protein
MTTGGELLQDPTRKACLQSIVALPTEGCFAPVQNRWAQEPPAEIGVQRVDNFIAHCLKNGERPSNRRLAVFAQRTFFCHVNTSPLKVRRRIII